MTRAIIVVAAIFLAGPAMAYEDAQILEYQKLEAKCHLGHTTGQARCTREAEEHMDQERFDACNAANDLKVVCCADAARVKVYKFQPMAHCAVKQ